MKSTKNDHLTEAFLDKIKANVNSPRFMSSMTSNTTADSQELAKKSAEADTIMKMKHIRLDGKRRTTRRIKKTLKVKKSMILNKKVKKAKKIAKTKTKLRA
jgi:hypothetical protein